MSYIHKGNPIKARKSEYQKLDAESAGLLWDFVAAMKESGVVIPDKVDAMLTKREGIKNRFPKKPKVSQD